MYTELATIKDGNNIYGFVVYDGDHTFIMDMDRMKKEAAAGNVDTLTYHDGQFIPIIQGPIAKELRNKFALKKARRAHAGMTFTDFVNQDCLFRKEDVGLMMTNKDVVLAEICLAFGRAPKYMLTMVFWSMHKSAVDKLKSTLEEYSQNISTIRKGRICDGFFTLNLPLKDDKCNFDLLSLREKTGLNFIYNPEPLQNMAERVNSVADSVPFVGKLYKLMSPTKTDLNILFSVEREANRLSSTALADHGVPYVLWDSIRL